MSSPLTRRGLDAPAFGVEDESWCSLSSSLTRRGLDARGAGAEGVDADLDGIMTGNFGPDAGEDVWGDFVAGVGGDAGDTSGGFCGAGASKNMASQNCGKAIIVKLLGINFVHFVMTALAPPLRNGQS
jgi:hypothetical protein